MSRISTSSWSLHRALGSPPLYGPGDPGPRPSSNGAMGLLDLPSALARADIPTLEIVHFHFPTMDASYVDDLKGAIDEARIELFSILIDAGDVTHPDGRMRAKEMAWIRSWLDVSARCGATHARVVGGYQAWSATMFRCWTIRSCSAARRVCASWRPTDPQSASR